jgi:hypothetical protein
MFYEIDIISNVNGDSGIFDFKGLMWLHDESGLGSEGILGREVQTLVQVSMEAMEINQVFAEDGGLKQEIDVIHRHCIQRGVRVFGLALVGVPELLAIHTGMRKHHQIRKNECGNNSIGSRHFYFIKRGVFI